MRLVNQLKNRACFRSALPEHRFAVAKKIPPEGGI